VKILIDSIKLLELTIYLCGLGSFLQLIFFMSSLLGIIFGLLFGFGLLLLAQG
jgi:hypothetical protein